MTQTADRHCEARARLHPWQSTLALAIIALAACTLMASAPHAQDNATQTSTPDQLVDALNGVFGKQKDNRAVHAKGIVLEGTFTPSASAASLSKAPHLQSTAVPVTVRFSDFAGVPTIPDTDPNASPRGVAVKFRTRAGLSNSGQLKSQSRSAPAPLPNARCCLLRMPYLTALSPRIR